MALIQASYDLYPRALRAVGLLLLAIVGRGAYIVYQKRASFRRMVKKHGIVSIPCPMSVHGRAMLKPAAGYTPRPLMGLWPPHHGRRSHVQVPKRHLRREPAVPPH